MNIYFVRNIKKRGRVRFLYLVVGVYLIEEVHLPKVFLLLINLIRGVVHSFVNSIQQFY